MIGEGDQAPAITTALSNGQTLDLAAPGGDQRGREQQTE